MDRVAVVCPNCGREGKLPAGMTVLPKTVKCPGCQHQFHPTAAQSDEFEVVPDSTVQLGELAIRAAAIVSERIKDAAKKAKDYATSEDAKSAMERAWRKAEEVGAKAKEVSANARDTASCLKSNGPIWREHPFFKGLSLRDWEFIAALLGLVAMLRLCNAVTPGVLALYTVCSLWVYRDARTRLNSAVPWSIGTLVLGLLVMPAYVAVRNLKDEETREGGKAWNVLKCFVLFWTVTMAVVAFSALGTTSEVAAAAKNDFEKAGVAIGAGIGFMLLAALWFFPMVGAVVLGFFLKKTTVVERGPTGALSTHPPYPLLSKGTFIGIGLICLLMIRVLSLSPPRVSLETPVDNGETSATVMTTGPLVYDTGYIRQLKMEYQNGFRGDALRRMMSNNLQVTNLDRPTKVTIIDRCPDYTTVRIQENSPELRARAMHFGRNMYIPNYMNW